MAKPLKYSEKVAVSFTKEQLDHIKQVADSTGDTVSGLLRRLAIQYATEYLKQ